MARALTVTVPALRACTINGRDYVRGELVTLPPIEAALHAYHRRVSLTRGLVIPDLRARALVDDLPARKPYRRRDLRAEP